MDPLAEQYYSFSTYGYTANNPTNFVDPDGAQIEAAVSHQGEGKDKQTTITLTITGSILDLSTNRISGASAMARRLKKRAKKISGRSVDVTGLGITDNDGNEISGNVTLNFDFQFEVANSVGEVSDDDHLIVLAEFNQSATGEKEGGVLGITNQVGGRVMHIDADWTTGLGAALGGSGTTIATHEILAHAFNGVSTRSEDSGTYVYENTQKKGRGFTSAQGRTILGHYYAGRLNQGPLFGTLPNTNNPRQPYKSPFTGWSNRGKSGSIFDPLVGVNSQKYVRGVRIKQ